MEKRDIFSILEDGQPFKAEQRTLRRDRKEVKIVKEKTIVKRTKQPKVQGDDTKVEPETNFVE